MQKSDCPPPSPPLLLLLLLLLCARARKFCTGIEQSSEVVKDEKYLREKLCRKWRVVTVLSGTPGTHAGMSDV